jgi:hypothetical protein
LKEKKFNYKEWRVVLKKLKEDKARSEAPIVSQTRIAIQDRIVHSMSSIEHLLKQENDLQSETDETVRKKRRVAATSFGSGAHICGQTTG